MVKKYSVRTKPNPQRTEPHPTSPPRDRRPEAAHDRETLASPSPSRAHRSKRTKHPGKSTTLAAIAKAANADADTDRTPPASHPVPTQGSTVRGALVQPHSGASFVPGFVPAGGKSKSSSSTTDPVTHAATSPPPHLPPSPPAPSASPTGTPIPVNVSPGKDPKEDTAPPSDSNVPDDPQQTPPAIAAHDDAEDADDALIRESELRWSKAGRKSAPQFAPGVNLSNAGKTASAKKKRKEARATNQAPTKKPGHWNHRTFVSFRFWLHQSDNGDLRAAAAAKFALLLELLQEDDPTASFGHLTLDDKPVLRAATDFPTRHKDTAAYFRYDGQPWQWEPMPANQSNRKYVGTARLFSDLPAAELLETNAVDMKTYMSMWVKDLQVLETVDHLTLLMAPNNIDPGIAASALRELLSTVEQEMIDEKKAQPSKHFETDILWNPGRFPQIVARREYPRGGPFDQGNRGKGGKKEDSSHKMAIVFQFAAEAEARVLAALRECKRQKLHRRLFGDFAILTFPPHSDTDPADRKRYHELLVQHQQITRSYNVRSVPGLDNAEHGVWIHTPRSSQRGVQLEKLCISDVFRYITVKLPSGRKQRVIQCCFPGKGGRYNIWSPSTIPAVDAKAAEVSRNAAAYCLHQCIRWGWDRERVKKLVARSFDPRVVSAAQRSKWDVVNNKVVCDSIGLEVDEALNEFNQFFWGNEQSKETIVEKAAAKATDVGAFKFQADDHTILSQDSTSSFITLADYDRTDEIEGEKLVDSANGDVPSEDSSESSQCSGFTTVVENVSVAVGSVASAGDSELAAHGVVQPDAEMQDSTDDAEMQDSTDQASDSDGGSVNSGFSTVAGLGDGDDDSIADGTVEEIRRRLDYSTVDGQDGQGGVSSECDVRGDLKVPSPDEGQCAAPAAGADMSIQAPPPAATK